MTAHRSEQANATHRPDDSLGGRGVSTTKIERELRKDLRELVAAVTTHIASLDAEMRKPSDMERGRRIAALLNALEIAKDRARYGSLGIDFRTGKPRKTPPVQRAASDLLGES